MINGSAIKRSSGSPRQVQVKEVAGDRALEDWIQLRDIEARQRPVELLLLALLVAKALLMLLGL